MLTEGSFGLREEGILVDCRSIDVTSPAAALVVCAAAAVVAAAESSSNEGNSLVNELAAAELGNS